MNSRTIAAFLISLGVAMFIYSGVSYKFSESSAADTSPNIFIPLAVGAIAYTCGIALAVADIGLLKRRVQ